MIPSTELENHGTPRIPRESGDDPDSETLKITKDPYSPRERG